MLLEAVSDTASQQSGYGDRIVIDAILELSDLDKAYLAGLFDGEGCIMLKPCNTHGVVFYRMRIAITNSYYPVLDWIQFMLGGSISTNKYELGKECYVWELGSKSAASVLQAILPYLRIKSRQAEVAIRFQATQKNGGGGAAYKYSSEDVYYRSQLVEQLVSLK